ncbi:MAG: hypothetical protein J5816_00855 [Clostridia bacterium]|nr:hypothetical protein [Clostridia bacterium]
MAQEEGFAICYASLAYNTLRAKLFAISAANSPQETLLNAETLTGSNPHN